MRIDKSQVTFHLDVKFEEYMPVGKQFKPKSGMKLNEESEGHLQFLPDLIADMIYEVVPWQEQNDEQGGIRLIYDMDECPYTEASLAEMLEAVETWVAMLPVIEASTAPSVWNSGTKTGYHREMALGKPVMPHSIRELLKPRKA